jgi:hypothetical protein
MPTQQKGEEKNKKKKDENKTLAFELPCENCRLFVRSLAPMKAKRFISTE